MEVAVLVMVVFAAVVGLQTFWIDRCIRKGTEDHRVFEQKFERQNDRLNDLEVQVRDSLNRMDVRLNGIEERLDRIEANQKRG